MIFTKASSNPNVLHVYEHVVSARIHDGMRAAGYYCYVDYALKARTFDRGYCFLEIELYNNASLPTVFGKNLNGVAFDKMDVQRAYLQVLAEEGNSFGFLSPSSNLVDEMIAIDALGWKSTNANEIESDLPLVEDSVLADDGPIEVKNYTIELNVELGNFDLPSAEDILKAFGHNMQVDLSNERGYYRELMEVSDEGIKLVFNVVKASVINIGEDLSYLKKIAGELVRSGSFHKFLYTNFSEKEFDSLVVILESFIAKWSTDCFEIE